MEPVASKDRASPMTIRIRLLLLSLAVLAAVSAAAYGAYWFHVAGEVRKGFDAWMAERRAVGWTVEVGEVVVGGFPGPVMLRMERPRLSAPEGVSWQAEHVTARAAPFDLSRVRVTLTGHHQFAFAGRGTTIDAGAADLLLHFHRDGSLDDATLTAAGLSLTSDGSEAVRVANVAATIDPLDAVNPGHDTPTIALIAAAQGIKLPPLAGLVMERKVALVDLRARVLGQLPLLPPAEAVARWSAEGGAVEIERIAVEWAPLTLEGEGTVAFDPRLQPLAAMTARVRGYGELLDRLSKAGMIAPGPAGAAKLLLGLMAKPEPRGRPSLPVPVTVQDGGLWFGPAKVMALPALEWPDTGSMK